MTVATFDPTQAATNDDAPPVVLTPTARQYIEQQLAKRGFDGLRFTVSESGCSGYMYVLDFVEGPSPDDVVYEIEGVRVYLETTALPMIRGTEIDYVTEGLNSVMKFTNPNATAECGCGESFAL